MKQSMEVLVSMESNEYYTPPWIIGIARKIMGDIDLDPASHPHPQQWIKAKKFFTAEDDGLNQDWPGRVFVNWPYVKFRNDNTNGIERIVKSPFSPIWAAKAIDQYEKKISEEIVILCFGKIGYNWFNRLVWNYDTLFFKERIRFRTPVSKNQGQWKEAKHCSALVYLGHNRLHFRDVCKDVGWFNAVEHLRRW